jgi:hypothetical protein
MILDNELTDWRAEVLIALTSLAKRRSAAVMEELRNMLQEHCVTHEGRMNYNKHRYLALGYLGTGFDGKPSDENIDVILMGNTKSFYGFWACWQVRKGINATKSYGKWRLRDKNAKSKPMGGWENRHLTYYIIPEDLYRDLLDYLDKSDDFKRHYAQGEII